MKGEKQSIPKILLFHQTVVIDVDDNISDNNNLKLSRYLVVIGGDLKPSQEQASSGTYDRYIYIYMYIYIIVTNI
jgi:hypothetical protein